jgi:hypothetical protein
VSRGVDGKTGEECYRLMWRNTLAIKGAMMMVVVVVVVVACKQKAALGLNSPKYYWKRIG